MQRFAGPRCPDVLWPPWSDVVLIEHMHYPLMLKTLCQLLKKTKPLIWKDRQTPVFIAVLFITGKIWKQPSADEWRKKMGHIYIIEYYLAIKKEWLRKTNTVWSYLHVESKKSKQRKKENNTETDAQRINRQLPDVVRSGWNKWKGLRFTNLHL